MDRREGERMDVEDMDMESYMESYGESDADRTIRKTERANRLAQPTGQDTKKQLGRKVRGSLFFLLRCIFTIHNIYGRAGLLGPSAEKHIQHLYGSVKGNEV